MKCSLSILVLLWVGSVGAAELTGFAVFPAESYTPGPTSGQFIETRNGIDVPFVDRQPVQGVSALLVDGDGYLALTDNGYGGKDNSRDYVLRVLRLEPDFKTKELRATTAFVLSDPQKLLGFPVVADAKTYPDSEIPVPDEIQKNRLLTGWDLDPESFRRVADGSFWIGDEFGPFLIHVDAMGRVLEPPVELPGMRAPQNPFRESAEKPRVLTSGGFEGMALSPDGTVLYPVIEKRLREDPEDRLRVYAYNLETSTWSEGPVAWYPIDHGYHKVTEFVAVGGTSFLAVERDDGEGPDAAHKRILRVDLAVSDESGRLVKTPVADLLAIDDPQDVAGMGNPFRFPFITTEAVAVLDEFTLIVVNDNNYPMSVGRHVEQGLPDDTEMIRLRLTPPTPAPEESKP